MPHHLGKAVSEDLVRRSGLAWTILQPGAYLQNLDLSGPVEVPYDVDAVFGFADLDDVAAVAALVLTEAGHVGATYELASRVASVAELAAEAGVRPPASTSALTGGSARCSPTTTPMGCRSASCRCAPCWRRKELRDARPDRPRRQRDDRPPTAGPAEDQRPPPWSRWRAVADLVAAGADVVLTHGNGPQVGNLLVKNELAAAVVPPVPLDWCGAQTQATIGFILMNALENGARRPRRRAPDRRAGDPHPGRRRRPRLQPPDQADRPLPPRGRGAPPDRARRDLGGPRREGLAPGRRVARAAARSSTRPPSRALVDAGFVVVAAGGGGIPVVRDADGTLRGVEAVIDKDLAAALLAADRRRRRAGDRHRRVQRRARLRHARGRGRSAR